MKLSLFVCYLLVTFAALLLRHLNLRHLKRYGVCIPPGFESSVDAEKLTKAVSYTVAQSRLNLVESVFDSLLLILFLFGGLIGFYDRFISSLSGSFVLKGVLFFLLLTLIQEILQAPFSLYRNFKLEARFGFNTMTLKLWLADFLKNTVLSVVLLTLLLGGALWLISASPTLWWLWVWVFFAIASLFLMYISPYVIEPLFFKFEPVTTEGLEEEIKAIMAKAGLAVSRVMQVDASKRSRHSNAYFTGIGRVKRIVLYDTLLQQMERGEIIAVLAHEVGHWKKGHIWRRIVLTEMGALVLAYVAYRLFAWGGLPGMLELSQASFAAQLVILGFLSTIIGFPFIPIGSWFSRRHERQADGYAAMLTENPADLASALIKLSTENLSNLHPHPLYAWFYYSHPPVVQRVQELKQWSTAHGGKGD